MTFVTFIIPSIGRSTLGRALESLDNQSDKDFAAIIVLDGCECPESFDYPWLSIMKLPKRLGVRNHAGEVRNHAIQKATSEWIAFLDDDDTASPNYVSYLKEELKMNPGADVVVFRMRTDKAGMHKVLPPLGVNTLQICRVGISFAVKKYPFTGGVDSRMFCFVPGHTEDFMALAHLYKSRVKMVLSPKVVYFVEMPVEDVTGFEVGDSIDISLKRERIA